MEWSQKMEAAVKNGRSPDLNAGTEKDSGQSPEAHAASEDNAGNGGASTNGSGAASAAAAPATAAPDTVGNLLLRTREKAGLSVEDIASVLRINWRYVQAIEEERYTDLPGRAYAVGFVRAYAEYFNLDAPDLVERFKREVTTISDQQTLSFPEPVSEGRSPTGALIFISLLLCAAAYGVWVLTSGSDSEPTPQVAEVPARLQAVIEKPVNQPANQPASNESGSASSTEAQPETPSTGVAAAPDAAQDAAQGAGTETINETGEQVAADSAETVETVTTNMTSAVSTVVNTGAAVSDTAEETVAEVQEEASEAAATVARLSGASLSDVGAPQSVAEARQAAAAEARAAETTETTSENSDSAAEGDETQVAAIETEEQDVSPQPVIYGEANVNARVVLRAVAETWLLIRAADGETLLSRILVPGDSFLVPNEPGVRMRIGNAGGVSVFVDGQEAPALGPSGGVRSNVILEPEPLLAGTAVPPRARPAPAPAAEPAPAAQDTVSPAPAAPAVQSQPLAPQPQAQPQTQQFPQPIQN